MARKTIDTATRKAIWEAHGTKSPYSGSLIPWNELQIDHIIPVGNPMHLERAIKTGIVDHKFDINGLENLLPARNFENSGKSDDSWTEGTIRFYLELAKAKIPKIESAIAKGLKTELALNSYLEIKSNAERNNVSVEDMFRYLRHQVDGEVPLRFTPAISGPVVSTANSSFAATLMDKPFDLGDGTINGFTVHSDSGATMTITTANEYLYSKEMGFYPLSNSEIKIASMAEQTAGLLVAVRDSIYAADSTIRNPIVTLKHLDKWSSEWATGALGDLEKASDWIAAHPTIKDLVEAGLCLVEKSEDWELSFSTKDGMSVLMQELIRADLDRDGMEEILIYHYIYEPTGTMGAGFTCVAKVGDDGLLREATA